MSMTGVVRVATQQEMISCTGYMLYWRHQNNSPQASSVNSRMNSAGGQADPAFLFTSAGPELTYVNVIVISFLWRDRAFIL